MSSNPRIRKPGHCPCGRKWEDDDQVIVTRSGQIACVSERYVFVPEAIISEGSYSEMKLRVPPESR
jgi:hypothetical protein